MIVIVTVTNSITIINIDIATYIDNVIDIDTNIINSTVILLLLNWYYYCHSYYTIIVIAIPVEWKSMCLMLLLYLLIECLGIYYYKYLLLFYLLTNVQGPWQCFEGLRIWIYIAMLYYIRVSCCNVLVEVSHYDQGNLSPWNIISFGLELTWFV